MTENFERLIGGRKDDPMLVDRETSDENGEIKINACETSETKRDTEKMEFLHVGNYRCGRLIVTRGCSHDEMTNDE
jgi:hypothetical protein